MSDNVAPAPPQSRTEYVAARIKADVANGVITPGELIKQTVLAKRYGVSPTPVREAMRILEADGVLTYSAHKGASVREMTPGSARDLYRLRAAAEREAAVMAVERMTPAALVGIQAKFDELTMALEDGSTPPAALSVLNKEFHFSIYNQSSKLVVQYLESLWTRFTTPTTLYVDHSMAVALHVDHKGILDAVKAGKAKLAGDLTAAHTLRAMDMREKLPQVRASGDVDSATLS